MKYVLWMTMFLILTLFGCNPLAQEQNMEQQATFVLTNTPTLAESRVPTLIVTTRIPTTTATPANTSFPQPSPTVAIMELPTATSTPTAIVTPTINQQCSTSEPVQVEQTDLAQGLVFIEGEEVDRRITVLGSASLENPVWFYPYPDNNTFSTISPKGDWIAFTTYNTIDSEKNIYTMAINVTNWHGDQGFQTQLENLMLSRFSANRWINDSQIVFPLAHEGTLFRWLIWSPFSNTEETLSVELPAISQRQRFLDYAYPIPDPRLELVVYPCEECGEAEYAVKQFQTGETVWDIDIGPNPSYDYRSYAYWSPNGEIVTVIGGEFLNQLLFFNRDGEKLYEITLPLLDEPGGVMIFNRAWSPDSKYLAFLRVSGTTGNYEQTLTYVDIEDGQVIDLCVNAQTGFPIWSPDSSKIAFSQQIEAFEQPRLISIVDIHSGDVVQLYDADGRGFVGWMDLPRAGE